MSEHFRHGDEFRQYLNHKWQMQRVYDAIEAYRDAVDTAWYHFHRELRPPCRKCGQWPCVCKE